MAQGTEELSCFGIYREEKLLPGLEKRKCLTEKVAFGKVLLNNFHLAIWRQMGAG